MIAKKHIIVPRTARYFTLGELNEHTENVWLVCHGYGQLAEYFIRKFQVLEDSKTFIIAPEALNKFYLQGFSGRVGANWMTKEDRDEEIADYVNYLDLLFSELKITFLPGIKKITVFGFSQGVATVCRWVAERKIDFDHLILWAGIFPPDLKSDFLSGIGTNNDSRITLVYGDKDELITEDLQSYIQDYKKNMKGLEVLSFDGGHEIKQEVLVKLK